MTPATIAAQLAAIAKTKNLTQSQLSEKSGVPQGTISRIFSGKVAANIETLCKIAEAVGAEIIVNLKNAEK
jgi:transcriptional regulator with XRE-family HTH domain